MTLADTSDANYLSGVTLSARALETDGYIVHSGIFETATTEIL